MSIYRHWVGENEPRLITANTHQRQRIFRSADACQCLIDEIYRARTETDCKLLAFVIMPDHLHLVLASVGQGSSRFMHLVKGRFARRYNEMRGGTGSVWQSRFHEAVLMSGQAFSRAIEYVEQNPVVARLVKQPEEYRWSTASGAFETDLAKYFGHEET